MILCLHNRIMVASSTMEAVCFPTTGFLFEACVSSWGEDCKADQKAVGYLCKSCSTLAPLDALYQAGHYYRVHSWLRLLVIIFYPQQPKAHSSTIESRKQEEASWSVLTCFLHVLWPKPVVSSAINPHHQCRWASKSNSNAQQQYSNACIVSG